jgi:hypothetical protein
MKQLKSDPKRTVIYPSRSDIDVADAAFKTVIEAWTAQDPHNRELLTLVRAQIAKFRSGRDPPGHE